MPRCARLSRLALYARRVRSCGAPSRRAPSRRVAPAVAAPRALAQDLARRGRSALLSFSLALGLTGVVAAPSSAQTLIRDAEIERTLRMLSKPIYDAGGLTAERVPIFMLGDRSLNAFVSGANVMFLHTGLLLELDTPEELMAVIAHESGHVIERHIVSRLAAQETARNTAIVSTIIAIGAAAAGAGEAGVGAASAGQQVAIRDLLRFTRAQESGADQTAVRLMDAAGIDPAAMLSVLERFEAQVGSFGVNPYTVTHPLSRARMQMLEVAVSNSSARGGRAPQDFYYWHARMRAKLDGFMAQPGSIAAPLRFNDPELDLYREAIYLHRLPDPDAAVDAIDRLIAMRPQDPYYWELKGQILYESGRGPDAVAPYRRAVEFAPNEPLIIAGLGQALLTVETPEADAEALRVLERAAIADPFDPSMRRPLAIAYARAGNDGMAAVVTAERLALSGRISEAQIHAERARNMLPTGSPGWLRAEDILGLRVNN